MKARTLTAIGEVLVLVLLLLLQLPTLSVVVYGQEPTQPDYEVSEGDISFNPASPVHVDTSVTISADIHNVGITWVTLEDNNDYIGYSFNVVDTAVVIETIDIDIRVRARDNSVTVTVEIDDTPVWVQVVTTIEGWVVKSPAVDRPIDTGAHTLEVYLSAGGGVLGGKLDVDWIKIDQTGVGETYFHAEDYDSTKSSGVNDIFPHDVVVGFYDGDPDAGGTLIGYNSTVGDTNYVHDLATNVYYIKNNGVATATQSWTAYPAGYHDIYVVADPANVISEGNEANNKAYKNIAIYAYLTITVTGRGTTDPEPDTYTYYGGTSDSVTAYPNPCWYFDYWELDDEYNGTDNPTTVEMDRDHTLRAVFSPKQTQGVIHVGIIQPEGWPQGQGMKEGAQIAAAWINDMGPGGGGGITVSGTTYTIQLHYGDEHASDLDIPAAEDEMRRLITVENCKFIYGGFRSECVFPIREVACDYKTPFFICGAADNQLVDCGTCPGGCGACVRCDYNRYRYLFRLTPNSTMLVYNLLGFLRYVPGMSLIPLMAQMYGDPVKTAVIAENLVWCDLLYNAFVYGGYLGPQADVVYHTRTPYGETNFVPYLDAMHAAQVRLIIILFSAPDSIIFMAQWAAHPIKAIPVGIDLTGQFEDMWPATAGGCEYEAFLATTGYRTPICPEVVPGCYPYTTREFWDRYVATYGRWPVYTSWAVYDGIIALKEILEEADPDCVCRYLLCETDDAECLIPFFERSDRDGIAGRFRFTGSGPHDCLSEQDYAAFTCGDCGRTYLDINPTMKGILHDPFLNEFLHGWCYGYVRFVWVQWRAGKLEVVWPKFSCVTELLSFWKRFLFPLRMWPYPLDLDYNGKVEMRDISLAARSFGSYPCHPRYDRGAALIVDDYPPGYDDEPVSMRDISAIARAFGTIYPLPVPY